LKSKSFSAPFILAAVISGFAGSVIACGPDFPNNLLDAGDSAVLQPPIADFKLELERMNLLPQTRAVPLADGQKYFEQSADVEMTDLAAALKSRGVPSEQATVILQAHLAERMKLNAFLGAQDAWKHFSSWGFDASGHYQALPNTNPPPVFPVIAITPGLPGEFADYFEGAIAWHKGGGDSAETAWERLLQRPAAERHFKSIWAAYMLGTAWDNDESNTNIINTADDDRALKYFQQVNELARQGFADSAGLATASIGREARIYLRRKNYERAIELYLEQFTVGDNSAMDSLRRTAVAALDEHGATPSQLQSLAGNSRTRRVIMAYLISRNPFNSRNEIADNPDAKKFFSRTDNWLAAVEAAGVKDMESAQELALAAYQAGDMDAAQRWVSRAGDSPVAEWLQAKLFLRAGKMTEAVNLLAKVSGEFPQELPGTNAPADFAQSLFVDINPVWGERIATGRQSSGELGVIHLARREYTEALDALLRSGYWSDATYVAERVLTTDELKTYVDRNWPPVSAARRANEARVVPDGYSEMSNPREQIRYLLARRLARETADQTALPYFPTNYSSNYKTLLVDLRAGHDGTLPAEIRAKNLFTAACMTRTNGMELFGTEVEPDWAIYGGEYDFDATWQDRATNHIQAKINVASTNEIELASSQNADPEKRFHYRWRAAALAWEAAQLMPDNSDETARVLCTGGTWLKSLDPKAADKFYKALVRRCRKTAIGDQADKMRWFPTLDENGKPEPARESWIETIEITPEMTNSVETNWVGDVVSTEFPVPGRKYKLHYHDDLRYIVRAVQRLGYQMTAMDILRANPGLDPAQLKVGQLITIPEMPERPKSTSLPLMPATAGAGN
jgi:tetratricopeptide (TPR) repeat protein